MYVNKAFIIIRKPTLFRKPTFTGLGMNFHSYTFINYKLNNIRTLLFRAYSICTSWTSLHEEVQFLVQYCKTNGYPESIVYRIVNKFLSSRFVCKPLKECANKLTMYHKIPFFNNESCRFLKRELNKIIGDFYPQIDLKTIFFNNLTIKGLVSHKERLPISLSSGICYQFTCDTCGALYVGSSKKKLFTRAQEHFGRSSRTGQQLASPPPSAIRDHMYTCSTSQSIDNFKILSTHSGNLELRIAESIEISLKNPSLNIDASSFPLYLNH